MSPSPSDVGFPPLGSAVVWAAAAFLLLACAQLLALLLLRGYRSLARRLEVRRRRRVLVHLRDSLLDPDTLPLAALEAAGEVGFAPVIRVLYETRERLAGATAAGAARALEVLGAQRPLLAMARSRWRRRRITGLELLGICGGGAAVPVVRQLLGHPDAVTRRFARRALARVAHEDGLHAALRSFVADEPNPYGWRAAFYSEVGLRAPEVLLQWSERQQLSDRHSKLVLEALSAVGHHDARRLALAAIDEEDPELRASAVRTLGLAGRNEDLAVVLALLADPVWFVRAAAARSLNGYEHQMSVRRVALSKALEDENWWVRSNAAEALRRLSFADLEPAEVLRDMEVPADLRRILDRTTPQGRRALAAALGRRAGDWRGGSVLAGPGDSREPLVH